MTHPDIASILQEIIDRYSEHYYPSLAKLIPLTPKWGNSPAPIKASVAQAQRIEKPLIADKKLEKPLSNPVQDSEAPPPPITHERLKKSSWECIPLPPDLSREEILKFRYSTLQAHCLNTPLDIPCGIFVDEEKDEEVLFFNRLSKILTQQIFPSRLILSTNHKDIFHKNTGLSLCLAPLTMIRYKIPNVRYHQSFMKDGCTWIPIYSSVYYENDPQLKRDLWVILNQLPFAYTQKS
ncbi:hypothetical protein [Chlamydia psittaci]|uniref:Uncharacterized protein n=1 Tax=Chlamydia psittaci 99DC5 TaxID=1112251 RepID=A0ABN0MQU9_CHLPS|nr:hypothetical protein [Chlamydia psittaci]AFS19912.1 hypothetical protein B595_0960 [Chlamydia psittaci 84/55]AFS23100.1 hypothetical protein B600_0957 [Chlamydia psittaci VS225]AGE75418.1 hypothetical protein AO9_04330 [Chlamydia psittaci Mat116]EPJ16452.1 hypothetical protein CP02DC18_0237 [Chlamydia psittaci 02DC18]EPJ17465.1 hypothetical protein CP02DC22_0228 [Chlamydia psittaci 02DC22]EPJ19387.1 hypothetical protein CP03DC29_1033 [Chlamydia psittaci 03DC29]EPJ20363.1 hypothetical prot